ncbi:hypothetical protein EIP86_004995 [Pleurotus ostreatoroseus]|nr:hypothetical protein EIP86_004995 [Pleurotus ostreatoroseus]
MSLSTSTTSTSAYILTKYSRAYPSASKIQESDAEWQHFTNPTIRLVLDMRKSSSGELESYRCRVLWCLSSGDDSMDIDQNEVTFVGAYILLGANKSNRGCLQEDLEFLSFSAPSLLQGQKQVFAIHGLPLKAVYRDAIVDAADATSFVDAIRPVCPCKANPPAPSAGLPKRSMTIAPRPSGSSNVTSGTMQPPAQPVQKPVLRPAMTMQPSRPPSFPGQRHIVTEELNTYSQPETQQMPLDQCSMAIDSTTAQPTSHLIRSATMSMPAQNTSFLVPLVPRPTSALPSGLPSASLASDHAVTTQHLPLAPSASVAPPPTIYPASLAADHGIPVQHLPLAPSATPLPTMGNYLTPPASFDSYPAAKAPPSSLPSTTDATTAAAETQDTRNAFLASLREMPSLYNLTRADLENLVAEVVREDGFLTLLQNLDSLWKVKALLPPVANAAANVAP